jgi:hypothetical protein
MKTYWLSFLFGVSVLSSLAQSDSLQKREFVKTYGKFKEKTIFHDKKKRFVTVQMSDEAARLLYEIHYKDGLREGTAKGFYEDGSPHWTANYKDDILHGPFMVWYKDGSIRRKEFYKRAYRKDKKCFDKNGDEVTFFEFQTQPYFVGGEYALQSYLRKKWPKIDIPFNTTESFMIELTIGADSVARPAFYRIENSQTRKTMLSIVEQMPKWVVGTLDGAPNQSSYKMGITLVNNNLYLSQLYREQQSRRSR